MLQFCLRARLPVPAACLRGWQDRLRSSGCGRHGRPGSRATLGLQRVVQHQVLKSCGLHQSTDQLPQTCRSGGPEEQYRPGFGYEDNYFLNELGVATIYPNVRGSSGYGKLFPHLDDGARREDAVKDLGALLDWIKTQPDLDSDRVLVEGSSYGGYLALSVAFMYGNRIKAAISDSGIFNLASFVEHTEGWRREIQRVEFGVACCLSKLDCNETSLTFLLISACSIHSRRLSESRQLFRTESRASRRS